MIELRFGAGNPEGKLHTLGQAGKVLGVSAERTRQIEERALKRLSQRTDVMALREAAWPPYDPGHRPGRSRSRPARHGSRRRSRAPAPPEPTVGVAAVR